MDTFLHSRSNQSFLVQLPARLQLPAQEAMLCGTRYNVPLLNALVFYVGIQVRTCLTEALSPTFMILDFI